MKAIFSVKQAFTIFMVFFTIVCASAQAEKYKSELDTLFRAFKDKDYEVMKSLLDPKVKIIDDIPTGMNDMILPQVVAQLPVPVGYKVISAEKEGDNTRITTEYSYAEGEPRLQYFVFNPGRKVVHLDILRDAQAETTGKCPDKP